MEYVNQFNSYQNTFEAKYLVEFMKTNYDIPVVMTVAYLAMVLYIPNAWMKDRKPFSCRAIFALWNLLLTVFSVAGSYYTVPRLAARVWAHGIRYSACAAPEDLYFNGAVGFWVGAFALSKIPELVDTAFLVVQKKDVIFLHWFHHATVMLFCWHAYAEKQSFGLWFATMNFAVHSIMYCYYFLGAIGARKLIRPIAPLITSLQILQMVVGMAVTVGTFVWRHIGEGCHVDPAPSRLGLMMYASYFILFAMLFKKLYLSGGRKKASDRKQA